MSFPNLKDTASDLQGRARGMPSPQKSRSTTFPPPRDRYALWRPLPPGACPSPRSHIPTDEEIIAAIAFVWCIHWNSFSTMDPDGLCARILAKHPSWHLLEKRVGDVRSHALADGRLRRPVFEAGVRMKPSMEEVRLREHAYDFDPRWRSAKRAQAGKLRYSFEITSGASVPPPNARDYPVTNTTPPGARTGEVVWGQLAAFVSGMKSAARDKENLTGTRASPWRFRAAARTGTWHVRLALPPLYLSLPLPLTASPRVLFPFHSRPSTR
jgi:hypothetical protein